MYLTAAALMIISALYFLIWGLRRTLPAVAALILLGLALGAEGVSEDGRTQFAHAKQIFRANSNFGQLQVVESDDEDKRSYLNDFLTQNTFDPQTKESTSMFTYMLHGLAKSYTQRVDDVLCIGMGVGIVPMKFAREGVRVDVVEINPSVVPIAQRFFNFDPSLLHLIIGDGRWYVNSAKKQYDAICLDAFLGDSSPSHLMSKEAFAAMRRVLKPDGVLVINSFCEFDKGKDYYAGSLDKTLKSVFSSVLIHAGGNGNVFFVVSANPQLRIVHDMDYESVDPHAQWWTREAFAQIKKVDPAAGIILTDDFNPIEYYDAANREDLRRAMATAMKR
jgi:spermidine synthase